MFDLGDVYNGQVTIIATDGVTLVDPSPAPTVLVTLPDASMVSPSVTRVSAGIYTFAYPTTQSGQHLVDWTATSPQFTHNDVFNVAVQPPGFIISIDEARKGIGFQSVNTVNDEDLRMFIAAATPIMEDIIGPVVTKTRVDTFDGGSPQIPLLYAPVKSVTTVIESYGSFIRTLTLQDPFSGSGGDAFGYTIDLTTGILTRRVNGVAAKFAPGLRNIQVTYIVGRTLTANQLMAARRLVRFLWQTEQQNYSPANTSPDAIGLTPNGFEVPVMVLTLCADSQRTEGVA